jgi:hypothetical protein
MLAGLKATNKAANAAEANAKTAVLHGGIMEAQTGYMRDALAETKKSADAATMSAVVAERALHSSQRPFVFLERVSIKTPIGDPGHRRSLNERIRYSSIDIDFLALRRNPTTCPKWQLSQGRICG